MKGVQFLVDDHGNKSVVLIDLKKNGELWEDFYDRAVAQSRELEPRESLESVKAKLLERRQTHRGSVRDFMPRGTEHDVHDPTRGLG